VVIAASTVADLRRGKPAVSKEATTSSSHSSMALGEHQAARMVCRMP